MDKCWPDEWPLDAIALIENGEEEIFHLKAENKRFEAWWNVAISFISRTDQIGKFIEFINKNNNEELKGVFDAIEEEVKCAIS